MAAATDRAEAHSTAPSLLLQTQAALGRLAASADAATGGGRRPYRVPSEWPQLLGDLAYLVYLLADQTGVSVDSAVRNVAAQVIAHAERTHAQSSASNDGNGWI